MTQKPIEVFAYLLSLNSCDEIWEYWNAEVKYSLF